MMTLRTSSIRVVEDPDSTRRSRAVARALIAEMQQQPMYAPLEMEPPLSWSCTLKLGAVLGLMFGGGMSVLWAVVHVARVRGWM